MDRAPVTMISEATFYGDARSEAPSVDTTIGEADVRVIVYRPTANNLDVTLPPLSTQERGGPRFYIINDSLFQFTLRRSDGTFLIQVGSRGGSNSPQVKMLLVGITDWAVMSFTSKFGVTS